MKRLLDDLLKLIVQQTDLYEALLQTLQRERQIILSSSVEELAKSNKKKEVVILQIKLLDELLIKLAERAGRQPCAGAEQGLLSSMLESIEHPACQAARSAYARLASLAQEVKHVNLENDRLIKGSLRSIKSSLSFLVACASEAAVCYGSSGQMRGEQVSMSLLNEEA